MLSLRVYPDFSRKDPFIKRVWVILISLFSRIVIGAQLRGNIFRSRLFRYEILMGKKLTGSIGAL